MDGEKRKAILAALQGTDVTRLTWASGQETLDLRLGHPPAPTTSVQAVPGMAGPAPLAAPPQPPPQSPPAHAAPPPPPPNAHHTPPPPTPPPLAPTCHPP